MKTLKLLSMLVLSLMLIQSCKKSKNDPFLSLKTRNARIVGEWKLETSHKDAKQTFVYNGETHEQISISDYSEGMEIVSGDYSDTNYYTHTLTLQKDGGAIMHYDAEEEEEEFSSTWIWLSNTKKKTGIVIDFDDFEIDRLTDKELILIQNSEFSSKDNDGSSSSYSRNIKMVYSKK